MIIGHVVFKRLDVIYRTIQHNALALHVDTLPLNISTKQEVFISFLLLFFQFSDPESFFPKVLHFEKRHRREGRGAGTPRGRARRRAANRVCPASESAGQDRRVSEPVASPSTVTVTVVDTELRKTRLILSTSDFMSSIHCIDLSSRRIRVTVRSDDRVYKYPSYREVPDSEPS